MKTVPAIFRPFPWSPGILASLLICSAFLHGEEKKKPALAVSWRAFDVPPAPVLEPEEALQSFRLPPGFRIELVAAEPLVEDPANAVWDADGRLWVAEMRGYMHTASGDHENEGYGRVVVLEDEDQDGRMDRSTCFLDGLVMPRSICHVEGGVLIGEPPNIWYCQDTDGDLVCDSKTLVYDSYGQRDAASRTASGLVPALDNWIYNSRLPVRFQFRDGKLITGEDAYRGDFGVAQDDVGRIYANTNSSWLHADLVPPGDLMRHPALTRPAGVYEKIVQDQEVCTIRVNTGVNQGYVEGMLRSDGRLAKTTAATWPGIYRGDRYPERYNGAAIVPEPAGNVVGCFSLQSPDGISLEATHEFTPDDKWGRREFLSSTDERFRPVQCSTGPDGCLYVTDFYRGIIEYKLFVSPFLNEQIVDRKLDQPLGLGRIYRIVHESQSPAPIPRLSAASDSDLIEELAHPNGWRRDTAQRLLVERSNSETVELLRKWIAECPDPLGRLHGLWTLEGVGGADWGMVRQGVSDDDSRVRAAAIRIAGSIPREDWRLADVISLAGDESPAVQLHTLLRLGDVSDKPEAREAMQELVAAHADDVLFREAAISGLAGRELVFLGEWKGDPGIGGDLFLRELATAACVDRDAAVIGGLLELAAASTEKTALQLAILDGVTRGVAKGNPVVFAARPGALERLRSSDDSQVQNRTRTVETRITWPGDAPGKADIVSLRPLTEEEQEQFRMGRQLYRETCMACHQIHGKGMASLAPPLVRSPWVLGPKERLVRIGLHGVHGPLVIGDVEWNLVMPGLAVNPRMTDENLASIFTYIRREWGNTADPVQPEDVAEIRALTKERIQPWTVEELETIP